MPFSQFIIPILISFCDCIKKLDWLAMDEMKLLEKAPSMKGIVKAARVDDTSLQMLEKFKGRKEKVLEPWVYNVHNFLQFNSNYFKYSSKSFRTTSIDHFYDKKSLERRLDESDKVISELLQDGRDMIQDIRVANDKREVERRVKEAEIREGETVFGNFLLYYTIFY